jgi:hypothetical protein
MNPLSKHILTALLVSLPAFASAECRAIAGMELCGGWTDHADHSVVTDGALGAASLVAPGLDIALPGANLVVQVDPPSIEGEVDFQLPNLGPLSDWGVAGELPRARISLGMGAGISAVEIGGVALPLHDEHPYLIYEIDDGLSLSFGAASISAGSQQAKVIIDPFEPLIYLEGDAVSALTGGLVSDGAVGVSLGGNLPFVSTESLPNGRNWSQRSVNAHVYARGNAQLGSYPVYVGATVALRADHDGDGQWFFEPGESGTDFQLGANGDLAVGWDRGVFSLTLPVATGSVVYRANTGKLQLAGQLESMNPFVGTAIESLFPEMTGGALWGYYNAPDDFLLTAEMEGRVMGFPSSDLEITLRDDGLSVAGSMEPQYGAIFGEQSVAFSGDISVDGQFVLDGTATLNFAGFQMADAQVTWTNSGLTAVGVVDIPGVGVVQIAGDIQTNGSFELTGAANFAPLGISLSSATATLSNAGVSVAGSLKIPGLSSVQVSGSVQSNGDFDLSGAGNLSIKGFDLAGATVRVRPTGVDIDGRLNIGIANGHISGGYRTMGSIQAATGVSAADLKDIVSIHQMFGLPLPSVLQPGFFLHAKMSLQIPVPGATVNLASADVWLRDTGVLVKGEVSYFGAKVKVSGSVKSNGDVDLTGKVSFDKKFAGTGVKGDLKLTVTESSLSGKVSGKACVNLVFDKVCASASASVNSSGKAKLNLPSPVPDITINVKDIL